MEDELNLHYFQNQYLSQQNQESISILLKFIRFITTRLDFKSNFIMVINFYEALNFKLALVYI